MRMRCLEASTIIRPATFRLLGMGLVSAPKQEPSRRRHQHEGDSAKALQRMGASNLPRILGEKHTFPTPANPPQPRPHNHVIDQQCSSTLACPNCALPASSRGEHPGVKPRSPVYFVTLGKFLNLSELNFLIHRVGTKTPTSKSLLICFRIK